MTKWKDNKDVDLLSSNHLRAEFATMVKLRRKHAEKLKEEMRNTVRVLTYQNEMKGVDLKIKSLLYSKL